jgi:hypothetical protein
MPEHPLDEFMRACLEFDTHLARLTTLRANHFGADPEAITWGEVGSLREANRMLREAVAFLARYCGGPA